MEELTKNDIKNIFTESLEPFAGAIQSDIIRLDKKIDVVSVELKSEIGEVKQSINEMRENSSALFTKLDEYIVRYDRQYPEFLAMNEHISRLEQRIERLETTV